jgi:hypothetical protein
MSEPWTSLVAALVGAIVGGAASQASTMVVNKQHMATNARLRLYYELLPNLERAMESAILPQVPEDQVAEEQMPELLEEVQRASAIAGGFERKAAYNLTALWKGHWNAPPPAMPMHPPEAVNPDPPPPPGYKRPPSPAERRLGKIQEEVRTFSDHLAAKLGT